MDLFCECCSSVMLIMELHTAGPKCLYELDVYKISLSFIEKQAVIHSCLSLMSLGARLIPDK